MSLSGWAKAIKSNNASCNSSMRGMRRGSSVGSSKQGRPAATASGKTNTRRKSSAVAKRGRKTDRPYPSAASKVQEAKWRAESDMNALAAAHEILKSPERVKAAQRVAKEKEVAAREAAQAVTGVKATTGE